MNTHIDALLASIHSLNAITIAWLCIGLLGQLLFSIRFVLQWLSSERHRKSVIPTAFWYFSIAGAIVLLAYAIHLRDPIFILGQCFGVFIYFRNLQLVYQHRKQTNLTAADMA